MKDLNELANKCHEAAVNKGFYEPAQSDTMICLLIMTEWFEALEAHRKGIEANIDLDFQTGIKDSVQDEIADTLIRLFDFAGYKGIKVFRLDYVNDFVDFETSFSEIVDVLNGIRKQRKHTTYNFANVIKSINCILDFCIFMNIDIEYFIEKKLEYNATRPYKHGKKY